MTPALAGQHARIGRGARGRRRRGHRGSPRGFRRAWFAGAGGQQENRQENTARREHGRPRRRVGYRHVRPLTRPAARVGHP
ncbi:hypothetical protein LI90_2568 [Carbonactinospora thermoautotrophica]|uniref:Uncharacterized protein n=1 Tax=Carbonactinospora thermoautotrophica TaxID=1469144 RepID=A0A132MUW9_9ACTN|nr:hypothetical protein LI90_2568 [Carbonactinospora thermoautotrophica]